MVLHPHESSFATPIEHRCDPKQTSDWGNDRPAVGSVGAATVIWTVTAWAAATQNGRAIATTKLAAPACRHGMPGLTIAMP